jgi:hypothetical protein
LNKKTIVETLQAAQVPFNNMTLADGSELLLLPSEGRLLGLFAPSDHRNFLWVNPWFASPESAVIFFAGEKWHNPGGDRTWLAPEIDAFFPDFPDTNMYRVPAELDPGAYTVTEQSTGFEFRNEFKVRLSRSRAWVSGTIIKTWKTAPNPFRFEDLADQVQYAGYTQRTELHITSQTTSPVAIWNLLQVPPGGEILVPTYSRAEPYIYVGSVHEYELRITDNLVRFRVNREGANKIGISAVASTGRIGYLAKDNDNEVLIVRNFSVDPSGEYLDRPWDAAGATATPVFSTQACFVDFELGKFAELEYHVPVVSDQTAQSDVSQVWAFRGEEASIRKIAQKLLSCSI